MKRLDKLYCDRMARNIRTTSKGKIPGLINKYLVKSDGPGFLLDVGCADGRFTDYVQKKTGLLVIGLEPNRKLFEQAVKLDREGLAFVNTSLEHFGNNAFGPGVSSQVKDHYDVVMFSSSLHEISSYCENPEKHYTEEPVKEAIAKAAKMLKPGGLLMIRDFVDSNYPAEMAPVRFRTRTVERDFMKFIKECPYIDKAVPCSVDILYGKVKGERAWCVRNDLLKEFLLCETWDPECRKRECMERKLVYSASELKGIIMDTGFGFDLEETVFTNEYGERFDKLVEKDKNWHWGRTTELLVARKR